MLDLENGKVEDVDLGGVEETERVAEEKQIYHAYPTGR